MNAEGRTEPQLVRPSVMYGRVSGCQSTRSIGPRRLVGGGAGCSGVPGDAGVGDGGGEVALVDDGVVPPAEQGRVGQAGRPAVDPVAHVVAHDLSKWYDQGPSCLPQSCSPAALRCRRLM